MLSLTLILVAIVAFYMAWNIGANDLANSMGDVVGSGALRLKQVIILAASMELLGAIFFSSRVTKTVAKGIIPIEIIDPHIVTVGALAAMLAAGIWITIATFFRMPVSTSHSIVGAMLGFGIGAAIEGVIPWNVINVQALLRIFASWLLSPFAGLILSYLIFMLIRKFIFNMVESVDRVERVFRYLVIASSCYIAFAHGSNDVANAIAPLSAALGMMGDAVPVWILAYGGIGIALGLATWGYKVVETIGKRITDLTPTRGFSADIATATTVIACSWFGMPVSTTHTLVGAVIGVGLAGGLSAVDLSVIRDIVYSWIVTVPVTTVISIVLYLGLMGVGL